MKILLLTPPMTQLNTPYPATAYLTGFLRSRGQQCVQSDPALELVLRLFSREGVGRIASELEQGAASSRLPRSCKSFLKQRDRYAETVPAAIRFLQGGDPSLALRIGSREFLPEGPRFDALAQLEHEAGEGLDWAFGALGTQDRAKYLASLFIDDLADVVREGIDPAFELSRYGEKLAASQASFEVLLGALSGKPTLVARVLEEITEELIALHRPDVLGLTVPFPGNVYGAFLMARKARALNPGLKIILGGGYVNTELRELQEPRVFDYVDFVTLDDGEMPFLSVLRVLEERDREDGGKRLLRTFVRENGRVVFKTDPTLHDIPHRDTGAPVYDGLPLGRYLSIFEMLNPMHRIWSDGRWNKLTLAHGCYWKKCSFCDTSLDYIGRYDPAGAELLVDRIEQVARETGQTGFHFVDEAAPPALLGGLADRLADRGVVISWWGNIRFEKTFTPALARKLARSGCIAVSGGLEVASDRLLKLMQKGVTVEQVARVTRAFSEAGVMVHAYLMYGFPTQTEQETIDALERVRQLFAAGCIQSAYWHRFSVTAHSPIGREPGKYGIRLIPDKKTEALVKSGRLFARNDLKFEDPTPCDHEMLGAGLRKALYNYMHGAGLEEDAHRWFERKVPRAKVPKDLVERALL